jgi:hypothetical protein
MELITNKPKRPDFLSAICILSFVGLGWRIFRSSFDMVAGFFTAAFAPVLDEAIRDLETETEPVSGVVTHVIQAVQQLMQHITAFGFLRILFSMGAVLGVVMMWNLKKQGFYLYTGFRVLILLVPLFVMGFNIISIFMVASGMVFTALFILLYGFNLKYMQ